MQALSKTDKTTVKYAAALGEKSGALALKIGMILGETVVCSRVSELRQRCQGGGLACLLFPLGDAEAFLCEQLAAEQAFDVRLLVCAPGGAGKEVPPEFFMVCTNLGFSKQIQAVIREASWRFWELDHEGCSVHEKYRKVMNRVSDGIVRFNADGVVTFANKTFCRWIGVHNAAGMSYQDLVEEQSRTAMKMCEGHLRQGVILPFTVMLKNDIMVFLDPIPRYRSDGGYDGMLALLRLWDAESDTARMEYEASRTTQYLFSLTSALNATFEFDDIVSEIVKAVLGLCGDVAVGVLIDGEPPVCHKGSLTFDDRLLEEMRLFCSRMPTDKNINVLMDMNVESDPIIPLVKKNGFAGAVSLDLHANEEHLGYLWILLSRKLEGMRELSSVLINTGALAGIALRNALNVRTMISEQRKRRRFYSDALAAVTNNKLILCEYDEFERYWQKCGGREARLPLKEPCDVPEARHLVADMLSADGVPDDLSFSMATCASEAATNVVKYGPPGLMSVKIGDNRIRIRFDDKGKGIAVNKLPKAILSPGYSESLTPSLGLGFSVMLKLCASLRIATGNKGTYLLLEAEIEKRETDPIDSFITFKDYDNCCS